MSVTNPGAPKSSKQITQETKELLQAKEVKQKQPDRSKAGLDNPCNFGNHNLNFDKNKTI